MKKASKDVGTSNINSTSTTLNTWKYIKRRWRLLARVLLRCLLISFIVSYFISFMIINNYIESSWNKKQAESCAEKVVTGSNLVSYDMKVESVGHTLKGLIEEVKPLKKYDLLFQKPFDDSNKINSKKFYEIDSKLNVKYKRNYLQINQRKFEHRLHASSKPLCPLTPPNLLGRLSIHFNETPPTLTEVANNNPYISLGGWYEPTDCVARSRVAFIIPHRARELHLRALLWHLHPILQRQQLAYKIYVVHQAGDHAFNKAKLMNIGFLEALSEDNYDCIVFHDVDLLPENDHLLYRCDETPKHFSVAIDKYAYKLPYISLFGGVTMVSPSQFRDVNGYSNMYWGWGGEDDDMFNRIFSRGYTIKRPPLHLARYKMSFHERDHGNGLNLMRFEILKQSVNRMKEDGLNSLIYNITSKYELPAYTNITADVGTAIVQCKTYLSEWTCRFVFWLCENFLVSCSMLQYNSTDDGTLDNTQTDLHKL